MIRINALNMLCIMFEGATWGGGGDKQNPVSETMPTLTADSAPEDGLMFQSASSASHGLRERDAKQTGFVYEPPYFSVTPRLHFVTSVLNVSAFSGAFWLSFTFSGLIKSITARRAGGGWDCLWLHGEGVGTGPNGAGR